MVISVCMTSLTIKSHNCGTSFLAVSGFNCITMSYGVSKRKHVNVCLALLSDDVLWKLGGRIVLMAL